MKRKNVYQYEIFPFEKVSPESDVILYGMGKVGQRYAEQVRATGYCRIRCAIDKNYEKIRGFSFPIYSPQWIEENHLFDTPIIVSVKNKTYMEQIIAELHRLGIKNELIISSTNNVAVEICEDENRECTVEEVTRQEIKETDVEQLVKLYSDIRKYIQVFNAGNLIRLGNDYDGGYVMLDRFKAGGVAYSFGIAEDVSWDYDMAKRGYNVYMYDPTINDIPFHNDSFHFFKKGIAGIEDCSENYQTLDYFISHNGHESKNNMVLKMDVEGAEYEFINSVSEATLLKFDQLIFEFHDIHKLCKSQYDCILKAFKKLNKTHTAIHVHANNWSDVLWVDDVAYPNVIEISYVKRGLYDMKEDNELMLPIAIDRPCWQGYKEIALGKWFV